MRPGGEYTAEQLNGLLRMLNGNYDLRGGGPTFAWGGCLLRLAY